MNTEQIIVSPKEAKDIEGKYRIQRRSVDARQRDIKVLLTILTDVHGRWIAKDAPIPLYAEPHFQDVTHADRAAYIIGAGPAGLFAALTLIEHGIKPIILERGQDVSTRKRAIARLNKNEGLDPESNYCFGEGGAGTFSDGKLFSRSKKRGDMQRVMELFHYFGAPDTVLYEAHAHIGSDLLPRIIQNMRQCILGHGGEIHFETCVTSLKEFKIENLKFKIKHTPIILAIGHSAHDTYRMLAHEGVALEAKGCAMGVRVEHPQELINRLMYYKGERLMVKGEGLMVKGERLMVKGERLMVKGERDSLIDYLGNASYSLVTQVNGKGVYSFCMCPGGHIVPAGSMAEGCVVNGMSASHRNSPYANSGMVVEIPSPALPTGGGRTAQALERLDYQEALEHLAWVEARAVGGIGAMAPAQRLNDFVEGRASANLPACSYLPGIVASRLDKWLPSEIGPYLQQGFRDFDRKYPGFITREAVVVGVESRSSSPVRILRDNDTMRSVSHPLLYPCGEGAGYAGGITSSALDGIRAAKQLTVDN